MDTTTKNTEHTHPEGFKIAFGVSIGSSSINGFYLTPQGDIRPLFSDVDQLKWTPKSLKGSKDLVYQFFDYLSEHTYDGRVGILFNSFGYAFDGGKTKNPGAPFAWVEETFNFSDTSLVGIMAEVVEEYPQFSETFLAVNRNWKTEHGEEVGGQWAKQIQGYLDEKDFKDCQWVIDLGGKSGTLYHREGDIYVKRESIFKDTTPNSLVDSPSEFIDYFNLEMAKLQQAGLDITEIAVLQTGVMREKNVQGIFSNNVGFHEYLTQEAESTYEAIDFARTVLGSDDVSSFTLVPLEDYKIRVIAEPGMGFFGRIWSSLMYNIFG